MIIYKKETYEKVGEVITNHSISLDEALDLLGAEKLQIENPWDPDYLIDGKEIWYDDLEMTADDDFDFNFHQLLNKCIVPNGSGRKCFSLAMLDDDDIKWMVEECPAWDYLDVTDDGGNNLFDIAKEKGFIPEQP